MKLCRLDLKVIEQFLHDVQREFPKINELLQLHRDSMTDAVLENMLSGYTFVDKAVAEGVDLFTLRYATALLELNHIVLCGLSEQVRQEYQAHIEAPTQRFYEQEEFYIDDILRWYYNPSCHLLKSMGFCLTLRVKSPISSQEEPAHSTMRRGND
jgi:hypothetical protein